MPLVDRITHCLAHEVITHREHIEVVRAEHLAMRDAVGWIRGRLMDIEMISPASKLESVVSPLSGFFRQLCQRKICPLTREQRNRASPPHTIVPDTHIVVSMLAET